MSTCRQFKHWTLSNQIYLLSSHLCFFFFLQGSCGLLFMAFWEHLSRNNFPYASIKSWIHFHPVSSLKSCSFFTTASHKRYFALAHCSAFPQPIHTHTCTSNCSKDLEICILHIKLLTTANKEPQQNRLPTNKNPTLLYLLLLKHKYVKCLRCFLVWMWSITELCCCINPQLTQTEHTLVTICLVHSETACSST